MGTSTSSSPGSTPSPPQANTSAQAPSTPQAGSSSQAPSASAPVQEDSHMQDPENYISEELNTALQQAMETASPPMSVDDPPTSSGRSVHPQIHTISIGRIIADVE
eukprot:12647129-Alexandrium_andersonii.AAC.1